MIRALVFTPLQNRFKIAKRLFVLFFCLAIYSCVDNSYREQSETTDAVQNIDPEKTTYQNVKLNLRKTELNNNSPFHFSSEKALIQDMNFEFSASIPALNKKMLPVSQTKKDTFPYSVFQIELYFNNQPINIDPAISESNWHQRYNYKTDLTKSVFYETDEMYLEHEQPLRFSFPLYLLEKYKSGEKGDLTIKIYQDYFVSAEHRYQRKVGNYTEDYYRKDTLFKRLYQSEYSVSVTVPSIYKTMIFCDSIILQDDDKWTPAGSDNTIWKSSYPDIYFAVSDVFRQQQGRSVIEHSTAKFTLGDSLYLLHYKENENFYIDVFDHDNLSSDDFLGEWSGELQSFKPGKKYTLSFGHIKRGYFHTRSFGKCNP